jgi:flagellar motor protein MotB
MKLVQSLIVAALVAVPVVSFAQSQPQPLTRAEVRAELVQLQKAGYNPSSDNTQYPQNIEAALARVQADNGSSAAAYGGVTQSNVASGSRAPMNHAAKSHAEMTESDVIGLGPIYAHS